MSKHLTQYRVFIGSPGGLEPERDWFEETLREFSKGVVERDGIMFHPVRWEKLHPPFGMSPQGWINRELRQCDYAIFLLHGRWGTPSVKGDESRTKEEWDLARGLHDHGHIRDIVLVHKQVRLVSKVDWKEFTKVRNFIDRVIDENVCSVHKFSRKREFIEIIEGYLERWRREHEAKDPYTVERSAIANSSIEEAASLAKAEQHEEAIATLDKLTTQLKRHPETSLRRAMARAYWQKAAILRDHFENRIAEELEAYDEVISASDGDSSLDELRNQAISFKNEILNPPSADEEEDAGENDSGVVPPNSSLPRDSPVVGGIPTTELSNSASH